MLGLSFQDTGVEDKKSSKVSTKKKEKMSKMYLYIVQNSSPRREGLSKENPKTQFCSQKKKIPTTKIHEAPAIKPKPTLNFTIVGLWGKISHNACNDF